MKDYDTGVESGDDLEEEDFSMWVPVKGSDTNDNVDYEKHIQLLI